MIRFTWRAPRQCRVGVGTVAIVGTLLTCCIPLLFAAAPAVAVSEIPDVPCVGDCDDDHRVSISELVMLVNIDLGHAQPATCSNGLPITGVNIAVIIQGVNKAVRGCPVLGAGDCCQCADFCAAPVDGTCGGCSVFFAASCSGASICVRPTRTATPIPQDTPTPTNTPAASDCCQCPRNCAVPVGGSCSPGCTIAFDADCGGGMLCVPHDATPVPTPTP